MAEIENHPFIKQAWPDLDKVIRFLPNERGVWATCTLCGLGLRGWPSAGPTAANARRHLDEYHPGWSEPGAATPVTETDNEKGGSHE